MRTFVTLGDKLAGAYNRLADRVAEQKLAIETQGPKNVDFPDAKMYAYVAYRSIFKILHRLQLRPDDVFVDIGCGKGRVVCCAATLAARKVIGIDVEAGLCEVARANAASLRGRRAEVEIVNLPAQQFDYRECTAVFLFNPFGESTLRETLASVERSIAHNPRRVRLAYLNPIHENVLRESACFTHAETWKRKPISRDRFETSFWTAG